MCGAMTTPPAPFRMRILIVGIGNPDRGDDGAGILAARELADLTSEGTDVVESNGDVGELLDRWAGVEAVYVIDAVCSGYPPGTIHCFHGPQVPSAWASLTSTHGLGLAQAIDLARALDRLPRELFVYGVEAHAYTPGAGMSPEVQRAVAEVVCRIRRQVQ